MHTWMANHHMRPVIAAGHDVRDLSLLALRDIVFIGKPDFCSRPEGEVNRLPAFDLSIDGVAGRVVAGNWAEATIPGGRLSLKAGAFPL